MRLALLLCSDLALRSGTALKVAPCNWSRDEGTVTVVSKFGRAVTLPVTDELQMLLSIAAEGQPPDSQVPFVDLLYGRRFCPSTFQRQFQALRVRLGIGGAARALTAHDLRRTTAVRVLEITSDLRLVQALLGHRELSHTFHYLDHRNTTVPRQLLEAAKMASRKESE